MVSSLAWAAPSTSVEEEKLALPILMAMYEKHQLLARNELDEGAAAAPMTSDELAATAQWLKNLRFGHFSARIRQDLEAYHEVLLATCATPPTDDVDAGFADHELRRKFWALMVDLDLDAAKARKYGYTRLAPMVEVDACVAHTIVIVLLKLDSAQLEQMAPATRMLVSFVHLLNHLAPATERHSDLQA